MAELEPNKVEVTIEEQSPILPVHVDALSNALADFGKKVREDIDRTDGLGDKDTADLFTGVSRSIDKLLWFVEAHLE